MEDWVFILEIHNEDGTSIYVCRNEYVAHRRLMEYVEQWWSEEFRNEPAAEQPDFLEDEDIERYFEKADESYDIYRLYVIEESRWGQEA